MLLKICFAQEKSSLRSCSLRDDMIHFQKLVLCSCVTSSDLITMLAQPAATCTSGVRSICGCFVIFSSQLLILAVKLKQHYELPAK